MRYCRPAFTSKNQISQMATRTVRSAERMTQRRSHIRSRHRARCYSEVTTARQSGMLRYVWNLDTFTIHFPHRHGWFRIPSSQRSPVEILCADACVVVVIVPGTRHAVHCFTSSMHWKPKLLAIRALFLQLFRKNEIHRRTLQLRS